MVRYAIKNEIIFSNKGTYLEKINAITEHLLSFGGTNIFFDNFYFGGLKLFCIKYLTLVFTDETTNTLYYFPIDDFSNKFLLQVFITYINKCKEQLTEAAFKKIEDYLEEKFA